MVDADAKGAIERLGPSITPQALKTFARQARKRMRTESGGVAILRALAQREVDVNRGDMRVARRTRPSRFGGGGAEQLCKFFEISQPQVRHCPIGCILSRPGDKVIALDGAGQRF